jgi:septum formation protein
MGETDEFRPPWSEGAGRDPRGDPHLYLASQSPRRRLLLEQMGLRVALVEAPIDETREPGEAPDEHVLRVAIEKARAGHARLLSSESRPVLAADTVVVLGDETFGKPADRESALRMLHALSGRSHRVLTAVAVISRFGEQRDLSQSRVTFRPLAGSEILAYWETGEPRDKAGAYAIQGRGALFIERLDGSYSGVMGLPIFETGRLLASAGLDVLGAP